MGVCKENVDSVLGGDVRGAILSLAVPAVVAMIVVAMYSVCDTYFLSAVGKTAVGGVCYPAVAVMQGVAMTFAFGTANMISGCIGKGEIASGEGYFSSGILGSLVFCGVIGCLVGLFSSMIADFCGGSGADSAVYLAVAGFSLPIFGIYFFYSACLRGEGHAVVVLVASVVGLVCNFVLDFLSVKVFAFGVIGVAVSTAVSQVVAGVVLVGFAVARSECCRVDIFMFDFRELFEVIGLGSSSFFRQLMCGVSAVVLNLVCKRLGGDLLAGATIASKVTVVVFAFGLGIGQGMQPVMAYYNGKGDRENVKKALIFALMLGGGVGIVCGVLQFAFSGVIARFMAVSSGEGGEVARRILVAGSFSTALSFCVVIINMAFQAVGCKVLNGVLSVVRQGVVFVPVILVLSWLFGGDGVVVSHLVADVVAFVVAAGLMKLLRNEMLASSHEIC